MRNQFLPFQLVQQLQAIYILQGNARFHNDIHIDTNTKKQHGSVSAHLEESSSGRQTTTSAPEHLHLQMYNQHRYIGSVCVQRQCTSSLISCHLPLISGCILV